MCRQNHTYAIDYFAIGVIGFEFMLGKRPYNGKTRKDIRDAIFAKQVQIRKHEIPEGWSIEAADFINKVGPSHKDSNKRLVFIKEASKSIGSQWAK
jgi:serine/threonine protein kinase